MVRRLGLVVATAAVAGAAAPQAAAHLPDLEQLPPEAIGVTLRDGTWYLGFRTAVRNAGPAAFRLRGLADATGGMDAHQLTEDGASLLAPAVGTLRYVTTFGHGHWHFMGFMRYELRGLDEAGRTIDRKQGFCVGDAPAFVTDWCGYGRPDLSTVELGIRPGGMDIYEPHVEGQELEIAPDAAPSGRYVLTSRIGARFAQTRSDNDSASTVFRLAWPLTNRAPVEVIGSCVGEGCAGTLPAAPTLPRLMRGSEARRLARRAVRTVAGTEGVRIRCRRVSRSVHRCRAVSRRVRARVRVRYVLVGAATRWHYDLDLVRGERRIRRTDWRGGTLGPGSAT